MDRTQYQSIMRTEGARPDKKGMGLQAIAGATVASVALLLSGCGSNDGGNEASPKETPSVAQGSSSGSPEVSQSSEIDQRIVEMADIAKAEQLSGISLNEFREYASNPSNTPLLNYIKTTFPGKYNNVQDPQGVEYYAIANADVNPETFWQMMILKGYDNNTVADNLTKINRWYTERAQEMTLMQEQPNINAVDKETIWAGRAAILACALIAEQIVKGSQLPDKSEQKADERVQKILVAGFGDRADYSEYYNSLYFAKLDGSTLNMNDYPEDEFYGDFLQLGNKGIGPLNGSLISGVNKKATSSPIDAYFQMQ